MRMIRGLGACLMAATLGMAAAPALADDDCDAPVGRWQSRDAVGQLASSKGWDLQRVKIDDGCYEIRARDANGRSFKAKLDPETLEIVRIKYRDHDDDRRRDRKRDRDGGQAENPTGPGDGAVRGSGTSSAPPGGFLGPGAAPRGQIE